MKITEVAAIISAYTLTLGLSTCSSNHVIRTNDGRAIVTNGESQTDNDTGMVSYKDTWGNRQQINRSDVRQLGELDK